MTHVSKDVEIVARALLAHTISTSGNNYGKENDKPDAWYKYIPMALTVVMAQDKAKVTKP